MSSLREIKDRIGSVKSTLKITSAMKLVASSKLRKAQKAVETLRPYESALCEILSDLAIASVADEPERLAWQTPPATHATLGTVRGGTACGGVERSETVVGGVCPTAEAVGVITAIVIISSNSSLCGGFNGNVVKKALEVVKECDGDVEVFAIGRRGADALRKAGYPSDDWSSLVARPTYAQSARLAARIAGNFNDGRYSKVLLVYNHFVTTAHQEVVVEQYLPFMPPAAPRGAGGVDEDFYIVEPGREEVVRELMPRVLALKFHAAVLDSTAAEHAARTVAMQTATDNAEDLLSELTLEYNKGRQQKITAEILDLLGGRTE